MLLLLPTVAACHLLINNGIITFFHALATGRGYAIQRLCGTSSGRVDQTQQLATACAVHVTEGRMCREQLYKA